VNKRLSIPFSLPARQRGVALVVGMIFLLVLTILGVNALRTTALEEQMAGNLQQRTVAFQDAEARITEVINLLNLGDPDKTLSTGDTCDTIDPDAVTNPDPLNSGVVSHYTCPEHLGSSNPGRLTDTAEGSQTALVHFRIESQTTTVGNATVELQQGVYQRGPNAQPGILQE
jgi:Tfp pilus assembly protein PilX